MKKVKILKKLIERMEDLKDRPSDAFMNGYNRGLDSAISLIEDKIKAIEKQLTIPDVSGMFSSKKIEQAYKDGVRDGILNGYGYFDEENYR